MNFWWREAIVILVLAALYSTAVVGLVFFLRKLKVSSRSRIFLAFIVFGAGAGLLAALAWPVDVITLIDLPGVLLGEKLYIWSIQYLGDPHSSQAHYTIPWLLRVPQVHVVASVIVWGLFGLAVQVVYNMRRRYANIFPCCRPVAGNQKEKSLWR